MNAFPSSILVGTDGSEDAATAARAAVELARETGAPLHVVHVVEPAHVYLAPPPSSGPRLPAQSTEQLREGGQRLLDEQVGRIEQEGGTVEGAHLRVGRPADEILRLSEELGLRLIVVGNQGVGGRLSRMRRFLMGSVSETVTRYAQSSVMVVRREHLDDR